jgi:hypothetical protein
VLVGKHAAQRIAAASLASTQWLARTSASTRAESALASSSRKRCQG